MRGVPVISRQSVAPSQAVEPQLPTTFFAIACGIMVANLFAPQPIALMIGASFGMEASAAAQITTLSMVGYALGLVLVLPLVDLLESRRLILTTLAASIAALLMASMSQSGRMLNAAVLLVSMSSCTVQMLVAVTAQQTSERARGEVVGKLMTGIMLGLLLSRPMASLVAGEFGWRAVFGSSAAVLFVLTLCMARSLRPSQPLQPTPYFTSLGSLLPLLMGEAVLRRRAAYQALLMVSFSAFWTAVGWRLAQPPFMLGSRGLALFSLAGAGGAIMAPLAGRAGDRGYSKKITLWAQVAVVVALVLIASIDIAADRQTLSSLSLLMLLAGAALLLDMGCIADQALGRRAVNLIRPDARGRMNGLFTASFFVGSAVGAALTGPAWSQYGWMGVCAIALTAAMIALTLRLTEPRTAS